MSLFMTFTHKYANIQLFQHSLLIKNSIANKAARAKFIGKEFKIDCKQIEKDLHAALKANNKIEIGRLIPIYYKQRIRTIPPNLFFQIVTFCARANKKKLLATTVKRWERNVCMSTNQWHAFVVSQTSLSSTDVLLALNSRGVLKCNNALVAYLQHALICDDKTALKHYVAACRKSKTVIDYRLNNYIAASYYLQPQNIDILMKIVSNLGDRCNNESLDNRSIVSNLLLQVVDACNCNDDLLFPFLRGLYKQRCQITLDCRLEIERNYEKSGAKIGDEVLRFLYILATNFDNFPYHHAFKDACLDYDKSLERVALELLPASDLEKFVNSSEIEEISYRKIAISLLFRKYLKNRDLNRVQELLSQIEEKYGDDILLPREIESLAILYAENDMLKEAVYYHDKLIKVGNIRVKNQLTLSIAILQIKNDQLSNAFKLISKHPCFFPKKSSPIKNRQDVSLLRKLIAECMKNFGFLPSLQLIDDCLSKYGYFSQNREAVLEPIVDYYLEKGDLSSLMSTCVKLIEKFRLCPFQFKIFQSLLQNTVFRDRFLKMIGYTFGKRNAQLKLLLSIIATGNLTIARGLLNQWKITNLNFVTFYYFYKWLVNDRNFEGLENLFNFSQTHWQHDVDGTTIYYYMLLICRETGDWEKFVEVWQKIHKDKSVDGESLEIMLILQDISKLKGNKVNIVISPSEYDECVEKTIKMGANFLRKEDFVGLKKFYSIPSKTFTVVRHLCENGQPREAHTLVTTLCKYGSQQINAIRYLANHLAVKGESKMLESLILSVSNNEFIVNQISSNIQRLKLTTGDFDGYLRLFEENANLTPNVNHLQFLITAKPDLIDRLKQYAFYDAYQRGVFVPLAFLIRFFAKNNLFAEVDELIGKCPNFVLLSVSLLCNDALRNGNEECLRYLLQKCARTPADKSEVYKSLIQLNLQRNQLKKARETVKEAGENGVEVEHAFAMQ